ncbi:MAG: helix-turn-helix domain-containing protein [Ruminococcaceae bacterium]|nr:helix-turn-helix domain-containing protein [Oscillospiraceae bacterium]
MNTTVFSENLKKFRCEKKLTQEQVAEKLRLNTQTVSRWECGTTLPDVMTLPEIAKLYGVTVDDFYKKHSVAYDNYAQRLSSLYEKTRDAEDFLHCRYEYEKLMKKGELSTVDKWNYATIHHFMLRSCKDIALEWYNKAIADGPEDDPHIYSRALALRADLLIELGKSDELMEELNEECRFDPDNVYKRELLVNVYLLTKRYEEAYAEFCRASEKFPGSWRLYIYGGSACESLGRRDEAFELWDRAGEIGTFFYDEYYCKASCYKDMGEYEKAHELYLEIAELLRRDGYDVEAEMAELEAAKIKAKI